MKTITAIIRVQPGREDEMRDALLAVADHVRAQEPETLGFHISRQSDDPCIFTTYERFADQAAMDRHNDSEAVAAFFETARPILDGDPVLILSDEISAG